MKKQPLLRADWKRRFLPTAALLLAAALIFIIARSWAAPEPENGPKAKEYAEYESCKVLTILADSTEPDPAADGGYRGDQLMLVEVTSGQYAGKTLQVYNYVGPLYGAPLEEGDNAVVTISTDADGSVVGTVYEYNRITPLAVVVALFLLAAILVGGKTGAKSLVGLVLTLACLFFVLIPALLKGAPTLPTVFFTCAYIAVVCLTILGGLSRKTVCAMLGTIAGTALALFFGLFAQHLVRIGGLRLDAVGPLLQLRQQGAEIGLRGLLVGGVVISALGAVMDVTMGIASSLSEVSAANPEMNRWQLFRSGMNIGRDMVGTMTNTLILAFLGSSFTLIMYLYTIGLSFHQLMSSPFLSVEVISGISSSIGVILSIPLTALICGFIYTPKKK